MPLPLHIFEPRYKELVRRCLDEPLEFGVVLLTSKGMASVGCTAKILRKLREYADGRMDIITEGQAVFQMTQLLEEKSYYEAVVEYLPEDSTAQGSQEETQLIELFDQCHNLLFNRAGEIAPQSRGASLAFRMAARLPLELDDRQRLLEMEAEADRRRFLLRYLKELLPQLADRQRVRRMAGGNGHGRN